MRRGMVLAAGLGLRMRPLTDTLPKPLIPVAGRTLVDRALDHMEAAGVGEAVVNFHYLGDMLCEHLRRRRNPQIIFSDETGELLETGGGVRQALPMLGETPFFVTNSDVVWTGPALDRLAETWTDNMDGLLLLHPRDKAVGYDGRGDFFLEGEGRIRRRGDETTAPTVFAGVQLLHPRLFEGSPEGPFSLNLLYDRALAAGRLFGLAHSGGWCHVGTPEGLALAEEALAK